MVRQHRSRCSSQYDDDTRQPRRRAPMAPDTPSHRNQAGYGKTLQYQTDGIRADEYGLSSSADVNPDRGYDHPWPPPGYLQHRADRKPYVSGDYQTSTHYAADHDRFQYRCHLDR